MPELKTDCRTKNYDSSQNICPPLLSWEYSISAGSIAAILFASSTIYSLVGVGDSRDPPLAHTTLPRKFTIKEWIRLDYSPLAREWAAPIPSARNTAGGEKKKSSLNLFRCSLGFLLFSKYFFYSRNNLISFMFSFIEILVVFIYFLKVYRNYFPSLTSIFFLFLEIFYFVCSCF